MAQIPITATPSGKSSPGKFIWHDLVTPDVRTAGKFYEKLFGWKINYRGQYAEIRNGGKLIAGISQVKPTHKKAQEGVWLPTISVADPDAAAARVTANGGKILKGPLDMGQRGQTILISDSQRADLVLLKAKGGDPSDTQAAIGDWLWDEIWTNNPVATKKFYTSVFNYNTASSGRDYQIFKHQGKWRAGIRYLKDRKKQVLWVPVVRVADPQALAQRAKKLGGVVWTHPDKSPTRGNTVLIADPTGALFLIQQWPATSTKKGH